MQAHMRKFSDKFSAFFPDNGTVYRICKRCPASAAKCLRAPLPFVAKIPFCGYRPHMDKAGRRARVSSVLRAEPFRQLRILPENPDRSGPLPVCACRAENALRSSAPVPCLSDLTSATRDTPLLYLVHYSVWSEKMQVFFQIFFPIQEISRKHPAMQKPPGRKGRGAGWVFGWCGYAAGVLSSVQVPE